MLKQLFKGSFVFTLINFSEKGVAILLFPFLMAYIAAEDLGHYDLIVSIISVLSIIASLELAQSTLRYTCEFDESSYAKLISTILFCIASCSIMLLCIVMYFKDWICTILKVDIQNLDYWVIMSGLVFLNAISGVLAVYNRSLQKFRVLVASSAIRVLSSSVLLIILIIFFRLGLTGLLYSLLGSSFLYTATLLISSRRKMGLFFDRQVAKRFLKFSYPLIFSSLFAVVSLQADRWILNSLYGTATVGVLGLSYRIASVFTIVVAGFSMALGPLVYEHYKCTKTPNRLVLLFKSFTALSFLIVSILLFVSSVYINHFVSPEYHEAKDIVYLILMTVCVSSLYLFFPGVGIEGKTRLMATLQAFSLLLKIVLMFIFSHSFGVFGVLFAGLISQTIFFIIYYKFSNKLYVVITASDSLLMFKLSLFVILSISFNCLLDSDVIKFMLNFVLFLMAFTKFGIFRKCDLDLIAITIRNFLIANKTIVGISKITKFVK